LFCIIDKILEKELERIGDAPALAGALEPGGYALSKSNKMYAELSNKLNCFIWMLLE
jgi:hypothetical protein